MLRITSHTRGFGSSVRGPQGRLPPAHPGGGSDANQVDAVGPQPLEQMLGSGARQLQHLDLGLRAEAEGQAVQHHLASPVFCRDWQPRYENICRTPARQTDFRSSQGN